MQKILMLVFALLVSTAWLSAQDYPQTDSSQAGTSASAQTKVQGCLQGSNGAYTLTSDSGTTYQLQGDPSMLSKHVGHEVQITGTPLGTGGSSNATSPTTGTSASGSQQTLTVDDIKHVSKSCNNASK
jgi:hypothetical protein